MSYPGYPAYPQQGPGQPGAPQPGAPVYQTAPLSYPLYPGTAAPQPVGFSTGYTPYPAQPYPSAGSGSYPPQSSPYPSTNPSNAPYPGGTPSSAPYPGSNPSSAPYPGSNPSSAPYPGSNPSSAPYPGAPPSSAPYPGASPSSAPYPGASPSSAPYPGVNPPSSTLYPGAKPQSNSPYPQGSGYPTSSSPYSSASSAYPPANSPYPSSPYHSGSAPSQGSSSLYPQQQSSYPSSSPSTGYQGYSGGHGPHSGGGRATSAPAFSQPHLTSSHSSGRAPTPTIRPANPFNPRNDAEVLRKAMKGFGTDEKAIIDVLTNRTNSQRQQIALEFKTLYGKDLISDLKSEISGKFEDLVVALMTPIPEFLAKELHHAISGIGTNEETVVEIICTANNYEMRCIKAAYEKLYGRSLEEELAGDTSGNFRRLLISLCQANRSEVFGVDANAAFQDAQALMRAGELRLGTDESTFNAILSSRSYSQLAAVFNEYQRLTGNDFESAIKSEFSGDIEAGMIAIVRSVRDKSGFFADQLYRAMDGAGTHDRALIRIITSRSEIDLGDVKVAFQQRFGKTLSEAVEGDTSGYYKKALLSIIA